ncbi:MAG: hypothetical protein IPN99_16255 [Bacteroidetes bacterium]|nr:hypothetical protein [Bacteroidota bacterium]
MNYALVDNIKVEPTPKQKAKCICCGKDVISRCGELKIWHWAHTVNENCDSWYEQETQWHRDWKKIFGKNNSEVIFNRNNKKHIADIFTFGKIVIELQNSPISTFTIKEREKFYGEKMLWLINSDPFQLKFNIYNSDPLYLKTYPSNFYFSSVLLQKEGWFLDFDDIVPEEKFIRFIEECGFRYEPKINKYFNSLSSRMRWSEDVIRRVKEFNEENGFSQRDKRLKYFSWSYPWKSWTAANCPTFIDYDNENLFYVKEGLGTRYGNGLIISKENFISKYKIEH